MCLSGYQAKSFAPICYSPLQKKATQDTEHRGLGLWQHFRKDAHNMMLVSPPCFGTQAAMLREADCQTFTRHDMSHGIGVDDLTQGS